jgi:hypothetical protein
MNCMRCLHGHLEANMYTLIYKDDSKNDSAFFIMFIIGLATFLDLLPP